MWRFLILLYGCGKRPYIRAVKIKEKIFIIEIKQYESAAEMIKRMNMP